jgi:O6-methylguanine-DNA--protein-cysteine methyltransferase
MPTPLCPFSMIVDESAVRTTGFTADPASLLHRTAAAMAHRTAVPLFVPCRRVVGSDGALNHYYYGLGHKRWLLEHEAALPQPRLF